MSEATRCEHWPRLGCSTRTRRRSVPLFATGTGFFLAADKVQVKYEMLRAHLVDRLPVTGGGGGARLLPGGVLSGVSLVRPAGDGRAARRAAGPSGAGQVGAGDRGVHSFGCTRIGCTGRRPGGGSVRGAAAPADRGTGPRPVTAGSFWLPAEASQVDYETLRAHLLEHDRLPDGLAAARFCSPRGG